jgi:hypothetical protein
MKTLDELWYGNISPFEQCTRGDKELKELMKLVVRNREELDGTLTEKQKEMLEKFEDTVMKRRRNLKHDPVEMTEEYLAVIDEVDEKIEKNREYHGFGSCHHVWSLKTDYLAEKGIEWKSPVVLNPKVRFD